MPGNQRNQRTQRNQRNPRKKRKYKKWKEPEKKKERRWKSEHVVGSNEWIEEVYQIKPKRKVSKEKRQRQRDKFLNSLSNEEYEKYEASMPIKPKQKKRYVDHQNMAERLGWIFCQETKTWKHPTYKNKEFKSLVEVINGYRYYSPYTEDQEEDPKGIAFNYKLNGSINKFNVYQDIWKLEEVHTRKGSRRERFRRENDQKWKIKNGINTPIY